MLILINATINLLFVVRKISGGQNPFRLGAVLYPRKGVLNVRDFMAKITFPFTCKKPHEFS